MHVHCDSTLKVTKAIGLCFSIYLFWTRKSALCTIVLSCLNDLFYIIIYVYIFIYREIPVTSPGRVLSPYATIPQSCWINRLSFITPVKTERNDCVFQSLFVTLLMFLIRIFYFTSAVLRQYVLLELPWTLSIISTKVPTGRLDGLFVLAALRVCVWPRRSDARNCIVVMALPMWIFFYTGLWSQYLILA